MSRPAGMGTTMGGKGLFAAAAVVALALPVAAQAQEALGMDALGQLESRYVQLNLGAGVGGESKSRFNVPGVLSGRINTDLDVGPVVTGLAGLGYTSGFGFEVEGLYLQNKVDTEAADRALNSPFDLKMKMTGGFANVKYEMVNPSPLFPYVAAGLGYGETQYRVFGDNGSSDGVLWQLKAGVAVPASDDVTVDLGYRFVRSPSYETTDRIMFQGQAYDATFKAATQVHVLTAGVRWAF
ncbi:MAG: porin family protein [Sphingobium sp.]|nr:MAG: porin family protein [Sphingobium sp.]